MAEISSRTNGTPRLLWYAATNDTAKAMTAQTVAVRPREEFVPAGTFMKRLRLLDSS